MKTYYDDRIVEILVSLCDETNTPFSDKVKKLALDGKVSEIVSLRIDPSQYETASSYYADNVVCEFLRKSTSFDLGLDLKADAEKLFFQNEIRNKNTNDRLDKLYRHHRPWTRDDLRLAEFFSKVKKTCSDLLGSIPKDLEGIFGKGSTFADTGKYITVPDKMSSRPTITKDARDFIPLWRNSAWCRSLCDSSTTSDPQTVRGNRFISVPKTATAERGICIEPSLNVYWQLAVGTHIKKRLERKFGYDLYTAQDRHRSMARDASSTGRWATIDLKNASDLMSYSLVRLVLPEDWFALLNSLRSRFTEVSGKNYKLEKFSSMGNGFTFELMTVILTSICYVLGEGRYALMSTNDDFGLSKVRFSRTGDISVFGDDIIVPTDVAQVLVKCLPIVGFEVNEKKTFLKGPFRESCGGDFFLGQDVRAFNLGESPHDPAGYIVLSNAVRKLGRQHRDGVFGFASYRRTWFRVLDAIPSDVRRLRGPEFLGDCVIHDEQERWQVRSHNKLCYRVTPDNRRFVRGLVPIIHKVKLKHFTPFVQLASALYGVPSSGVTPRKSSDSVVGYRKRWLAVGL